MFNGKETVRKKMLHKFLNFCDFFQKETFGRKILGSFHIHTHKHIKNGN